MKKLICMILLISTVMLSSCSPLGIEVLVPDYEIYNAFENDTWLVVGNMLINKIDGKAYPMVIENRTTQPAELEIQYDGSYAYQYVFDESSLKQYTFMTSNLDHSLEGSYQECVITYDYEGKEIDRSYIGEPLSKDEMDEIYKTNRAAIKTFSFEVDRFTNTKREYEDTKKQAVWDFAEELYEAQEKETTIVIGLARPMGEELWFSAVVSKYRDSLRGETALLGGIHQSEIKAYDSETNELQTLFEYNEKGKQIIDFDENGIYVLDSWGNFSFVDFETEKSTVIKRFPSAIASVVITDNYICADYSANGRAYFVYEKGGAVIADHTYFKLEVQ